MPREIDAPNPAALLAAMNVWIAKGYECFVKWTCPKCGKRCTSPDANQFHAAGYYHDEPGCGALYTGPSYGFTAIAGPPDVVRELALAADREKPGFEGPMPGINAERN